MSTHVQRVVTSRVAERYEDARRRYAAGGVSLEAACVAAGISRGQYHRLAVSQRVRGGPEVVPTPEGSSPQSIGGRAGMRARWAALGHPVRTPEESRAHRTAYTRAYYHRRRAADPLAVVHDRIRSRLNGRARRSAAWASVPPPRLRGGRLVISARLVPLLTEDERRLLFGATAAQGPQPAPGVGA